MTKFGQGHRLRLAARKLGEALKREGVLPSSNLVHNLTFRELGALVKADDNPSLKAELVQKWVNNRQFIIVITQF